jgi:hypothetical protein
LLRFFPHFEEKFFKNLEFALLNTGSKALQKSDTEYELILILYKLTKNLLIFSEKGDIFHI